VCVISDLEEFLFVLKVISGHLGWVRCIAVEPGNQWFVTGSADRTIKVRGWKKSLIKFAGGVFFVLLFKKKFSALGKDFLGTAYRIMNCRTLFFLT